jgi:hypothetical protein
MYVLTNISKKSSLLSAHVKLTYCILNYYRSNLISFQLVFDLYPLENLSFVINAKRIMAKHAQSKKLRLKHCAAM